MCLRDGRRPTILPALFARVMEDQQFQYGREASANLERSGESARAPPPPEAQLPSSRGWHNRNMCHGGGIAGDNVWGVSMGADDIAPTVAEHHVGSSFRSHRGIRARDQLASRRTFRREGQPRFSRLALPLSTSVKQLRMGRAVLDRRIGQGVRRCLTTCRGRGEHSPFWQGVPRCVPRSTVSYHHIRNSTEGESPRKLKYLRP